jgi:RNA polymerase sigma factor (TIGR02999 family)
MAQCGQGEIHNEIHGTAAPVYSTAIIPGARHRRAPTSPALSLLYRLAYIQRQAGEGRRIGNMDSHGNVTRLLEAYADGDAQALNDVIPIVYRELKSLARAQLRRSEMGHRMETTALVHEAYEKLVLGQAPSVDNRRHFFGIAARSMRQIVVDRYRAHRTGKRGGGVEHEPLQTSSLVDFGAPEDLLAFDAALERLAAEDASLAEAVDLSCFAGLSTPEIAGLLDTTERTVQRKLARARAWLGHFLNETSG